MNSINITLYFIDYDNTNLIQGIEIFNLKTKNIIGKWQRIDNFYNNGKYFTWNIPLNNNRIVDSLGVALSGGILMSMYR